MNNPGAIRTTNEELFSFADSADMAWMVYRRFGRDLVSATAAWNRLMQNNCNATQFSELVSYSQFNDGE